MSNANEKNNETLTDEVLQEDIVNESEVEVETAEELNEDQAADAVDIAEKIKVAMEEADYRYKRLQADFDNFRKRTQNEKEQLTSFVKGELIQDLLSVLDNFDRALKVDTTPENESFLEGFKMIHQSFVETLEKNGLSEIKAIGEEFDPNYHQAVMNGPSDKYENNQIDEVYQKGYEVDGRVIRPSMVKVVNNG